MKFLEVIRATNNKRDLALVLLMLKTQMTISEIINVKVLDYNREGISI